MHCANCGKELPEGATICTCASAESSAAKPASGFSGFVRSYAPILVIGVIILVIILVQPMTPHGFSITGTFKKGPFHQQAPTHAGPRDVDVWLATTLIPPPGFKYRNSQLERLRPRLIPVHWKLEVDGLAEGEHLSCLTSSAAGCTVSMCGEDGCDFTVPSSSCRTVSPGKLSCEGTFAWKIRDYYDAVRSDKPVLIRE